MSAVHSEFEGNGGFDSHSSHVKTVAAMYGPVRVKSTRANGEPLGLLAADATQADYDKASPITYDLSDFPPCLLIHGAEDPAVPLSGTLELYTKLTKLNRECELHVFAGEGHAFDRRSSTQEGMVDIMDESSIYGPTVMRLIAQFFEKISLITSLVTQSFRVHAADQCLLGSWLFQQRLSSKPCLNQ